MIPAASSFFRRSARILVAMPSPDSWNSLNVRKPRTIRSRMISSDQRSPNLSREILTEQPDRRFDLGLPGTSDTLSKITCETQVNITSLISTPHHRHFANHHEVRSFTEESSAPWRSS